MWLNENKLNELPWVVCKRNRWVSWVWLDICPELAEKIRKAGGSFSLAGFIFEIRRDGQGIERFVVRFPAKQKKLRRKAAV